MSKEQFIQGLLALSDERADFEKARREWSLRLLLEDEPHECLCGRMVREEVCLIEHRRTRRLARIGSCCAEDHMRMSTKKIFASWRRVGEDPAKAFNEAFVDFAFRNGILTPWERDFYKDTWRMRAMTLDQAKKRKQINLKALREIRSRRGDTARDPERGPLQRTGGVVSDPPRATIERKTEPIHAAFGDLPVDKCRS